VPENSNLVHSICHPESGRGSDLDFWKCANDLLQNEGDRVVEWLDQVQENFPVVVAQAKRDYLRQINLPNFP